MNKKKPHRFLLLLAVASFLIATVQGIIYYSGYDTFFKTLLVLQNSINAFGFKASITIKDVVAFINKDPGTYKIAVSYAYCIAVFTAPYCTVSFVYKFLERVLRLFIGFRRGKNCDHILIFGYNNDVRAMLKNRSDKGAKTCIHIITAEAMSHEEVYRLNKNGCMVHNADLLKAEAAEIGEIMSKCCVRLASSIILFEDSSIRNFSLLQLFRLSEDNGSGSIQLRHGAKISCRCDDEGISRLIAGYYNKTAGKEACYDLELIDLAEMQIHKMYSDVPLYSVYKGTDTPLKEQTVHLFVAGLGKLGQQAVLQAMNLGVLHEQNRIVIDVFDSDMDNKFQVFAKQFSEGSFSFGKNSMTLRSDTADGELTVNFFKANAKHRDFYDTVRSRNSELPYTYAVITLENVDLAVSCAMQVSEIFASGLRGVPVLMRMDSDRRLAGYISSDSDDLRDIRLIDDRSVVITLEMILNRTIDSRAKEYNHLYNNIAIITGDDSGSTSNSDADPEKEWNSIRLFRRSSSKAAAYHDEVKDMLIPALARENGVQLEAQLEHLLGENGTLMKYTGNAWRMNGTELEVLEKLKNEPFAYELAALEHRRWCCYMASIGWQCGKRDDRLRHNPCMVTQEKLIEIMPEMCKYDLMSLMARYRTMRSK